MSAANSWGASATVDITALLSVEHRIRLVAQPVVDLQRGVIVGYETLTRFDLDPPVSPDKVFIQAWQQGLGQLLEACVVQRALRLKQDLPQDCFLTINLDPESLLSAAVHAVLSQSQISGVVFELTEHRRVADMSAVRRAVDQLRARGAIVAMDDAGAGYAGLKQLLELRPQLIKLDRELVSGIDTDEAKRALVQMLGEFASRIDAWMLAEGIETAGELRTLRQLGVPLGQGYFLARPAPPWAALTPQAQHVLDAALPNPSKPGLRGCLDLCNTVRQAEAWPLDAELCVRLDEYQRPIALRHFDASGNYVRSEHELLRVKLNSELSAVARRAAVREAWLRWDPMVCIDEDGKFLGVVRMARLVTALADLSSSSAQRPALAAARDSLAV